MSLTLNMTHRNELLPCIIYNYFAFCVYVLIYCNDFNFYQNIPAWWHFPQTDKLPRNVGKALTNRPLYNSY